MERETKAPLTREAVEGIRRGCCQPVYRPEELIDQLAQSHELLRARLDAAEQRWQPIETAPLDGTYVLLWYPYWRNQHPIIGRWFHGEWDSESILLDSNAPPPEGWMPLPAPPVDR